MTVKEIIFFCILLGNAIVSALYLMFGLLYVKRCESKDAAERKKAEAAQEETGTEEKPKNVQKEAETKDKSKSAQEEAAEDEETQEELPMKDGRIVYVMKFVVMLLCPLAGPIFFGVGHLLFRFIFRQDVHLEDVVFSKSACARMSARTRSARGILRPWRRRLQSAIKKACAA